MSRKSELKNTTGLPSLLGAATFAAAVMFGATTVSPVIGDGSALADHHAAGEKCNPCAGAKCNPCAAKCGGCNPCAAAKCNPCGGCNPCAAKKKCNPAPIAARSDERILLADHHGKCGGCNPCAAKCGGCNPCAAAKCGGCGGCNPCAAKCGGCNPCAAKKKCNPAAVV